MQFLKRTSKSLEDLKVEGFKIRVTHQMPGRLPLQASMFSGDPLKLQDSHQNN
jgi:hypothetical protein